MDLVDENIAQCVDVYRRLRKRIKEMDDAHAKVMEGKRTQLEQLGGHLQTFLKRTGQTAAKTPAGTFYESTRYTASANDKEAFINYVREADNFALLDVRANATAVRDHVQKFNACPPGVTLNAHTSIGVRAPKGQAAPGEKEDE